MIHLGKKIAASGRSRLAASGMLLLALVAVPGKGTAEERRFDCTAWGGSHTGRYTFRIDPRACTVFWEQIDRELAIKTCDPPVLVALKPFAPASGYVLRFNLETGTFSDHVPGWADRGSCRERAQG